MKKNGVSWGIASLCLLTTLGVLVASYDGIGQQVTPTQSTSAKRLPVKGQKKNFPAVEYPSDQLIPDEARRTKSKKYDKYIVLNPNIVEDSEEISFGHWLKSTNALPIIDSDFVAVGTLIDAKAFLSEKKTSVYSEFKIEIEKVFKGSDALIENKKFVRAEREGGIVLFPQGVKTWYHVSGQGMPSVGGRYLFFLTHDFPQYGRQSKDLFLLTAYFLQEGKVQPLDSADGGTHPTATHYLDASEAKLLSDVEGVVKNRIRVPQ